MPANIRWDLIQRLKGKITSQTEREVKNVCQAVSFGATYCVCVCVCVCVCFCVCVCVWIVLRVVSCTAVRYSQTIIGLWKHLKMHTLIHHDKFWILWLISRAPPPAM